MEELANKEKSGYVLPKDHRLGEFILATKFLTSRFLKMEAVVRTSKQIWCSTNGFKIKHCGNHRVHDVPERFMNRVVAKSICETIGKRIFRRPMRPLPIQRQEGEFSGTVADRTGEGEAIMEIKKSRDDINSKSVTISKSVTDKERESETGNVLNQEKPNPLCSQPISKSNCHDHLFPQSRSKNKFQGHTSTASSEGEREKLHKFPPSPRIAHSSLQKWKPPDHGLVKINCDGTRFTKENRAGIGVAIRNSESMVLGSLSKQLSQAFSPLQIEAMAVETTLQFAGDLGVQNAILETDSLLLVKALREVTVFLSTVGLVLDEIRNMVNFFTELHYSHVKREGNIVAHKLAHHAICVLVFAMWMEDAPLPLFSVVLADIAGFT